MKIKRLLTSKARFDRARPPAVFVETLRLLDVERPLMSA
jgi:hypothetical protein